MTGQFSQFTCSLKVQLFYTLVMMLKLIEYLRFIQNTQKESLFVQPSNNTYMHCVA